MNVLIILIFSTLHGANIREISEIAKVFPVFNTSKNQRSPTDFTDFTDFSNFLFSYWKEFLRPPLAKRGSLSHSQALQ